MRNSWIPVCVSMLLAAMALGTAVAQDDQPLASSSPPPESSTSPPVAPSPAPSSSPYESDPTWTSSPPYSSGPGTQSTVPPTSSSGSYTQHECIMDGKVVPCPPPCDPSAANSCAVYCVDSADLKCPPPAYHDAAAEPCMKKIQLVQDRIHALREEARKQMEALGLGLEKPASDGPFDSAPIQAHQEKMRAIWDRFHQDLKALLGECARFAQEGPSPGPAPMPMPEKARPAWSKDAEVIHQDCMAKANEIMQAFRDVVHDAASKMPIPSALPPLPAGDGSALPSLPVPIQPPMPQPFEMPEDIQAKLKALWADCELRMRAIYKDFEGRNEHDEKHDGSFGSLSFQESDGTIGVVGQFLALTGHVATNSMSNIMCRAVVIAESLSFAGDPQFNPEASKSGSSIRISDRDGNFRMAIHDDKRCHIEMSGGDAFVINLKLPDSFSCKSNDKGDLKCLNAEGKPAALLLLKGCPAKSESLNDYKIKCKAALMAADEDAQDSTLGDKADQFERKIEQKQVAEVKIGRKDGKMAVDSAAMGTDLTVKVLDEGKDFAKGDKKKIVSRVESPTHDGRIVKYELPADLFGSEGAQVIVQAVNPDGSLTDLDTEEASLDDVINQVNKNDPDLKQIFAIVYQKDGSAVALVSISSFSEKQVTILSGGNDAAGEKTGLPTIGAFATMLAGLAALVIAIRRRD